MTDDYLDLVNQFRKSSGLAPIATDSGKSSILGFVYTVSLNDTAGTVKDVESIEVHEIGETIFDTETGALGTILRIERKTKRI